MSIVMLLVVFIVIGIPIGAIVLVLIIKRVKNNKESKYTEDMTLKQTPQEMLTAAPNSHVGDEIKKDSHVKPMGGPEKSHQSFGDPAKNEIEKMIDERRMERAERSAGFCSKCGRPIQQSDIFCPGCGEKVSR